MRQILFGTTIAVFVTATTLVGASADEKGADELAVEGLSKLMNALSLFVDAIPQYSAPEILENGDIIIRRKNKNTEENETDDKKPELEETST
ncbi:MAG: hypothetical protein V7727_14315 [Sneathiella sp.]